MHICTDIMVLKIHHAEKKIYLKEKLTVLVTLTKLRVFGNSIVEFIELLCIELHPQKSIRMSKELISFE